MFQISSTAEEGDRKIIRHVLHSIDSDVLILLLAYIATELVSYNDSLNLYFNLVTPNPTWYNILSLIQHLTIDVFKVLPYFYAFIGCNTVSNFNGKGKCTFVYTWMGSKKKNNLTKPFIKLGNMPESITSDDKNTLEFPVKTVYLEMQKTLKILVLMKRENVNSHNLLQMI